jgi:hypothetical protein
LSAVRIITLIAWHELCDRKEDRIEKMDSLKNENDKIEKPKCRLALI